MGGFGNLGGMLKGSGGGGAAAPSKPVPQSDYTRDIIARGSQAIKDRQQASQYGRPTGSQALTFLNQTGYGGQGDNDLYDQWYAQQGFQPQQYPVTFGQSAKGNYAGFRTEGELKAAIKGRAEGMRHADQQQARTDAAGVSGQLDNLSGYYDTQSTQAIQDALASLGPMVDAVNQYGAATQHPTTVQLGMTHKIGDSSGRSTSGAVAGGPAVAPTGLDADAYAYGGGGVDATTQADIAKHQMGLAKTTLDQQLGDVRGRQDDLVGYTDQLNEWLARQSDPLQQQLQAAQQRQQVPLADYGMRAGAEYGVDPNLLAGWYDDTSRVSDYNTQRNIDSLDEYGVPYSDFNQWVGQQQQQAATAQRDQATQQTADTQAQADAQEQQISDDVYGVTRMDAAQLAQAADLTTTQLYSIVMDPQYQQAASDLGGTLASDEFQNADEDAQQEMVGSVLNQWRSSPEVYRLLTAQYGEFLN